MVDEGRAGRRGGYGGDYGRGGRGRGRGDAGRGRGGCGKQNGNDHSRIELSRFQMEDPLPRKKGKKQRNARSPTTVPPLARPQVLVQGEVTTPQASFSLSETRDGFVAVRATTRPGERAARFFQVLANFFMPHGVQTVYHYDIVILNRKRLADLVMPREAWMKCERQFVVGECDVAAEGPQLLPKSSVDLS